MHDTNNHANLSERRKIMAKEQKERTPEQQAIVDSMDAAAKEAGESLTLMKEAGAGTLDSILVWYKTWYTKAGHKRLGRLLVKAGQ